MNYATTPDDEIDNFVTCFQNGQQILKHAMIGEKEANKAIFEAVQALLKAAELANKVEYGSEIRTALDEALKSAEHALHVARQ